MATTPKPAPPTLAEMSAAIAAAADPSTPDYVSPPVKIASTQAGFRRAGQIFGLTPATYPAGTFTSLQMAQLKAERKLVVIELDPKSGKAAPEFNPAKTEGQLVDHLAADPAGLTTILAGLGFVPKAAAVPAPATADAPPAPPATGASTGGATEGAAA